MRAVAGLPHALRRALVCLALLACAVVAAPTGALAGAGSVPVVRAPTLASGVTAVIQALVEARGFDRAHGFEFAPSEPYNSLEAYYADFVAGRYDVEIGITESYAVRYFRGAPIRLVATATVNGAEIVVRGQALATVGNLRGKTVVAPITSGRYLLARALLQQYHGIDLERDARVISAPSPTAALTFLLAGRAEAALSWEPAVTVALQANPELRLLFESDREYRQRTGRELFQVVLAAHETFLRERQALVARVVQAYADAAAFLHAHPEQAVELVARRTELPAAAVLEAIREGRLVYAVRPVQDPAVKQALQDHFRMLRSLGYLDREVPDEFLATF